MPEVELEISGKRGIAAFRYRGIKGDETYTHFEDKPSFAEVDVLADRYLEEYALGELDRLDVAYTRFESLSKQTATVETLLPLSSLGGPEEKKAEGTARIDVRVSAFGRKHFGRSCADQLQSKVVQVLSRFRRERADRSEGGDEIGHRQCGQIDQGAEHGVQPCTAEPDYRRDYGSAWGAWKR